MIYQQQHTQTALAAAMEEAVADDRYVFSRKPYYPGVTLHTRGQRFTRERLVVAALSELQFAGVPEVHRKRFEDEALDGDYEHAVDTVVKWMVVK